jgi:hypothetical protein
MAAEPTCPDPAPSLELALEKVTTALVEADDPAAAIAEVEAAWPCVDATPAQVARYLVLRGAERQLGHDGDGARPWFAVATQVDPGAWDPRLGDDLRRAYDRATPLPEGELAVDVPALVDGTRQAKFPVAVPAGPHVVQVTRGAYARVATVPAGERLSLVTGLPPERTTRKRRPAFLVGAGVAALAAGGLAAAAVSQDLAMTTAANARDATALDQAYATQQGTAYASYACMGLTVVGFGLYFVVM